MSDTYSAQRAQRYDRVWRTYTARTHEMVLALLDFPALEDTRARRGEPVRLLDIGCGTGLLLAKLLDRLPQAAATGVEASDAMLARARVTLAAHPAVRLERAALGPGETAGLPFAPATFDLVTCTSVLHYLAEPVAALAGVRRLLAPGGQLVLLDYARPGPRQLRLALDPLLRWGDPGYRRAYTLTEARALCAQAGLRVAAERTLAFARLFHVWAVRALA
ncbi:MAG: methyltransferase [Ktedonobacterales bacterium]|nr:methyltransferase [Ktedonobacterales bacterium]